MYARGMVMLSVYLRAVRSRSQAGYLPGTHLLFRPPGMPKLEGPTSRLGPNRAPASPHITSRDLTDPSLPTHTRYQPHDPAPRDRRQVFASR